MLLLIDNYDSFTFNLAQYLGELKAEVAVYRNDAVSVEDAVAMSPEAIVLSPGPCTPSEAGICVELVKRAGRESIPLLGICLGHQSIGAAFGGNVVRCHEIVHGKTDSIFHQGSALLNGLPNPLVATRYHSLIVERESLPEQLAVVAWTEDDIVMAIQHRRLPIYGLQFHPESIATPQGHDMLDSFLAKSGVKR